MSNWEYICENVEIIIAISSIAIAAIALGFSIWQGVTTRKHNRKMVVPFIAFNSEVNPTENYYKVVIINNGTGPAVIKSVTLKFDNEKEIDFNRENTGKLIKRAGFPKITIESKSGTLDPGYYVRLGEEITLLYLEFDRNKSFTLTQIRKASLRVNIIINYSSIYDDKYYCNLHVNDR